MRPRRLLTRYVAGLASAYLLTAVEVIAIVGLLGGRDVVTPENVITAAALLAVGTATVGVSAAYILLPALRYLRAGREPTAAERRSTLTMMRRQAAATVAPWILTAAVLVPLNLDAGSEALAVIGSAMLFGTIATVCTGFLFTLRTLRPVLASVAVDSSTPTLTAPGVRARLLLMWTVCTALPGVAIAALLIMRNNGWLLEETAAIELALIVLALVAVVLGLRSLILTSMSISDPVQEVVQAMADVERGQIDRSVEVYEWSEIGRLQRGFNRMVAGLRERDRLRDLFGRHVGEDVVRRAIEENESLSGDERDVAVLFIDLVGSTPLAATHEPAEVAELLNEFFRIVVAAVDQRHGLINKFQGDAALAVFGAPLRVDDPASAALMTARDLVTDLQRLPLDFGIGVSAGPVFAGNIGAENRYEYTVVGDAVNEAARLADRAKEFPARALCSGSALERASTAERRRWEAQGSENLRGRSAPTQMWTPAAEPG
ncbi:adenylate/guanylate cyclase domain-containing protein [Mycolicibacterium novocastrense]|uniref:Adenylate/guanylate cyclase domain-containing protein n=1 Tax=Mycolicibacterium novocastrense TaxID=59813 RepID=A0AAW5STE7_MYCNV|nr:adenylate/guanylate cyclase domain-containing protein [Mycolicibacterium novocastrense]MCV7027191.1 adenylate/guanylate cyclase domain-containing protein [Mycolicibacterium novocastrense]GAT06970.1 family 3 adenylate cyclase [Mycolicibacterium novocastrense]